MAIRRPPDSVARPARKLAPCLLLLALGCALVASPLAARERQKKRAQPSCEGAAPELSQSDKEFLAKAELLISDEERAAFVCLQQQYQRDAFIDRFWRARDTYPDTARNEFREQWEERLLAVHQLFDDPQDVRARYYLINGPPPLREPICPERSSTKIEAWFYGFDSLPEVFAAVARRQLRKGQVAIVFFAPYGTRTYRVWLPSDKFDPVSPADAGEGLSAGCRQDVLEAALTVIQMRNSIGGALGFEYEKYIAEKMEKPPPPSDEWLLTFESYTTDLPPDAPRLSATVEVSYPGRRQQRTIVQVLAKVARDGAIAAEALGYQAYAFEAIGEILRTDEQDGGDKLFESFRYRFELPEKEVPGDSMPLVMQRYLRPGAYSLVLRIDDLNGHAVWRDQIALEVPNVEETADAAIDAELDTVFAEANGRLRQGEPSIRLVVPAKDLISGYQRFETVTTGPIDKVVFTLDGATLFIRHRPPFSVDLDLGRLPKAQLLRAVAYDDQDKEVASDAYLVNGSPYRFSVRLIDPAAGSSHERSVRVRATVTVPEGRTLESIDIFRNDEQVATLYQEPWVQPVELPNGKQLTVLRAVAHLTDGTATEDTVIINGPGALDEVRVDFVELYTTVTDRAGHPLLDLGQGDFEVLEDGVAQTIRRFERVEDTPIRGTILLDVSASMADRLDRTVAAAARFFKQVVRERDELSVVTFNDRPQLVAPFTGSLPRLAEGLIGLRAERGTALYDSLIYTLYHLNGLGGQRVVLLLSDGRDEHSRYSFDDTLEYARRSEAAIYAIGIELDKKGSGPDNPRKVLEKLATETGGRAFFLDDLEQLDAIYDTIAQELRAKYLIAYQSSNNQDSNAFRRVEVRVVGRAGAEARTMQGYYP